MVRVQIDIESAELETVIRERLEHAGHVVSNVAPMVVVTDDALRAMTYLARVPTVMVADTNQLRAAVAAMRAGAYGYVFVPLQPGELELMVGRAALGLLPLEGGQPLRLDEIEVRYIRAVVERFKGNQTKAARALGIGRNTLWRKLKQRRDADSSQE